MDAGGGELWSTWMGIEEPLDVDDRWGAWLPEPIPEPQGRPVVAL